ncbi:MBL fold metallo-hydrolase [Helicobacter bizzozeronii]|uniref:MBL fold metallo-hydrolase n=1 Tax=Helicobacter bizzozeronii TaxID=56877 RepID=UPI000CED9955|nr:MBL fold metallo-hydrolase [Helicobacter bizzozeronii]
MSANPPKNAKSPQASIRLRRVGLFETSVNTEVVPVRGLLEGINDIGKFIVNMKKHVKLGEKPEVEWIIDKTCNHRGDKLLHNKGIASCPYCNWSLDLKTLTYHNGYKKQPLRYCVEGRSLRIQTSTDLSNPYQSSFKGDFKIRWLNHACLHIEAGGIKCITDPWLLGPSFLGSGYLETASCKEAVHCLVNADFIFISSNRSSCLHPQTLAFVPKSKPFLIGNFASKSIEKALRGLGFTNIYTLEFQEIYEFSSFFQFSILRAGDGSEESGLYLCLSGHDVIINAYGNYLNTFNLPTDLTLLCTSFAGATSGFPFCIDNYDNEQKKALHANHLEGLKQQLELLLERTKPTYVMPIATPYIQEASRDQAIQNANSKNALDLGKQICDTYTRSHRETPIVWLQPDYTLTLEFKENDLIQWREDVHVLKRDVPQKYVDFYTRTFVYDANKLMGYLKLSGYKAQQIVTFVPTDDSFEKVVGPIVQADFATQSFKTIQADAIITQQQGYRVMVLKVRGEILACVVENHLPFEEILRGFHCRIQRTPNVYEAQFWRYFSHFYTDSKPYTIRLV